MTDSLYGNGLGRGIEPQHWFWLKGEAQSRAALIDLTIIFLIIELIVKFALFCSANSPNQRYTISCKKNKNQRGNKASHLT